MKGRISALALLAIAFLPSPVWADELVEWWNGASPVYARGDSTNGAWVNCKAGCSSVSPPTIAATATGQLPVTNSSARVLLGDTSGNFENIIVTNFGSVTAYVAIGTSSITATTSSTPVPPGLTIQIPQVATTNTDLAAITASGTTTLNIIQTSSPMQLAGGSGGSGGSSSGAVFGPTAVGSPTANPPVPVGGSADGTATGNVNIWKVGTGGIGFVSAVVPSGGIASGAFAVGAGADGWDVTEGAKADAACATSMGTCSLIALLKYNNEQAATTATNTAAAIPAGTNNIGNVGQISQYPVGATPLTASATGTTGATTATLTEVTSSYTFICGFSIRANATAAATGNATVTGTITGTLNFTQWTAPLASGLGVTEEIFAPCVEASAISTSIAVVSAAPGSGGVVSVTAWGYTKPTSP
jgi:hypothetical protein